ncbi:MAG TPA: transcription antiterminator LicT [Lachnospiraceae bacterium]|nr:transcription antiterminator LicT [Lachnospiraceae bacterium]
MKISKQLNNNIIIASDSQGREVVLMGKGIGFGCRIGEEPDMNLVEKQFFGLSSGQHIPQLAELLNRIPLEHLSVGIQIVEHVEKKIQKPLNETLVLMISDHVNFAIERKKKGMDLTNALLWEIRKFYPDEYQLGLDALDIIEGETGVRLSEDEAGFLAMHIVNAQYGSGESLAQDLLQLIQDVVNLVRYTYRMDLDENSLDYIRFVTHLKFFLSRIFTKKTWAGNEDLYGIVSVMYPKAAACAEKISAYIRQKLQYSLGLEEQGYLIIHIEKLTRN